MPKISSWQRRSTTSRCAQIDGALCVGDIAGGRGDVDRCVELLEQHSVPTVRGNHDRWCVGGAQRADDEIGQVVAGQPRPLDATPIGDLAPSTRSFLAALPSTRRFETTAGPLLLCHGFGDNDMVFVDDVLSSGDENARRQEGARLERLIPSDVEIVVCGHSHRRGVRRLGRLAVVNAGTLRSDHCPCFAVLDLAEKVVQFYDLDEGGKVLESSAKRVEIGRSETKRRIRTRHVATLSAHTLRVEIELRRQIRAAAPPEKAPKALRDRWRTITASEFTPPEGEEK